MGRIIGVYALLGPVVGALLYVALSALAGAIGIRSNVFIDAALLGSTAQTLNLAGWQIALSAPFSLAPAILTGWLTARRVAGRELAPGGSAASGAGSSAGSEASRRSWRRRVAIRTCRSSRTLCRAPR